MVWLRNVAEVRSRPVRAEVQPVRLYAVHLLGERIYFDDFSSHMARRARFKRKSDQVSLRIMPTGIDVATFVASAARHKERSGDRSGNTPPHMKVNRRITPRRPKTTVPHQAFRSSDALVPSSGTLESRTPSL